MKALTVLGATFAAIVVLNASWLLPPQDSLGYHPEYWTWLALAACVIAAVTLLVVGARWAAAGVVAGLLLTLAFWAALLAAIIHDGGLD